MLDKLQTIENRFNEINRLLETNAADYQKITELARERSELEPIINKSREYQSAQKKLEEARSLLDSSDAELRQMAQAELHDLEPRLTELESEIKKLIRTQRSPATDKNVNC